MTAATLGATFTLGQVQEMLGLSRTIVAGLIAAGFVSPARGARNAHRFSFQDLLLMRTALSLQRAKVPPRKILRSLARLKADLPAELPLTGLRITAVGADVAVRDPSGPWQADSGQRLFDFEVRGSGGSVSFITAPAPPPQLSVLDGFRQGQALEASDRVAAEAAYRRAIEHDRQQVGPYLNLVAMLCEAGRHDEAVALCELAADVIAAEPLAHFNHAIALEDARRLPDAIAAYERALALDPAFGDAHFNLALLLERVGDARGALRHFSAYRRAGQEKRP